MNRGMTRAMPCSMIRTFSPATYHGHMDALAAKDKRLEQIIDQWGYPPFWSRPGGFAGLARIILEQQVSLASALSTWNRLETRLGQVRPGAVLALSAEEMAGLGITRQKATYIRGLAATFQDPVLRNTLGFLETLPDHEVRTVLTALKGIGPWTADIYLIMGLHRMDVFPTGDLALNKALDALGILPLGNPPDKIYGGLAPFSPLRSLLACLLWHWYIQNRP